MAFRSAKNFTEQEIADAIDMHLKTHGNPEAGETLSDSPISPEEKALAFREKKALWPRRKHSEPRIEPEASKAS